MVPPASQNTSKPFSGLSVKLITVIILVILAVEVAVYLPSVANYRASWLNDRLRVGAVAARVLDAVPDLMDLNAELTDPLLRSAGALAIVYRREGQSELIALDAVAMPSEAVTADMREDGPIDLIVGALDTLFAGGGGRILRIVGHPPNSGDVVVEVLMPELPLRADMLTYSRNILILSLIIAGMTALVIFVFMQRVLIDPILKLIESVLSFRQAPENGTLIIVPSRRNDELGVLEREMAAMQADIFSMLRQRRHLADLGLAVAKINHDLRNMLTSAQLLSDQVATLDDPRVNRLAPRLVTTLDRAIAFAQTVLDYGRQSVAPPRPGAVDLRALASEAAGAAGLVGHPRIHFENAVPDDLVIVIDPDHFDRVLVNLLKNAREALEGAGDKIAEPRIAVSVKEQEDEEGDLRILVSDNGPGLPPRARENLFVAFEGAARSGGTGLGLAIARELSEANGARLSLEDAGPGTTFAIAIPAALRER